MTTSLSNLDAQPRRDLGSAFVVTPVNGLVCVMHLEM